MGTRGLKARVGRKCCISRGEDRLNFGINVTAHQEKNEKTGIKKAGERRGQATDFRKAVCCPTSVVQRAARQKMVLRECPG